MKSVRFTLLNLLILAGLGFGVAGSVFASQAPKIKPKASGSLAGSLARGLGNTLWFSATHPILTGTALAGLGAYYLYCCRSISLKKLLPVTDEISGFDASATSAGKEFTNKTQYAFWNLKLGSSSELVSDWKQTYRVFKNNFGPQKEKDGFIKSAKRKINEEEKPALMTQLAQLDNYFSESRLMPKIIQSRYKRMNNPVMALVDSYMKEQRIEHFHQLSKEQVEYLDKKVEALTSYSIFYLLNKKPWETFNWHRLFAFPNYEADAIENYWKLYQMVAHLNAIQVCLDEAGKDNTL